MARQFEIHVENGCLRFIVGGQESDSGTGPSSECGCCCAPTVIGPIVWTGSGVQSASSGTSSTGAVSGGWGSGSPYNPPIGTGGGPSGGGSPYNPPIGTGGGPRGGGSPYNPPIGTGGGGPKSGSGSGSGCCCAPVVIGPIVITDCCSGQQAIAPDPVMPTEISIDPPTGFTLESAAKKAGSPFVMQTQRESNWCWDAVAVSVHNFLDPQASPLEQPDFATELINSLSPNSDVNCSLPAQAESPRVCNKPEALDTALRLTGNLRPGGYLVNHFLSFASLQKWMNADHLVCARIVWRTGGAHFVALNGCTVTPSGRQLVLVQDPILGSRPSFWDYAALRDNYDGVGFWNDTYLIQS